MRELMLPVSPGEAIDKLTILAIKEARIDDAGKLSHVRHERALLQAAIAAEVPQDETLARLSTELATINEALWQIEDDIRARDAAGDFGARFVALARAVYVTNDRRAAVKKAINQHLGSALVEEKSYTRHGG